MCSYCGEERAITKVFGPEKDKVGDLAQRTRSWRCRVVRSRTMRWGELGMWLGCRTQEMCTELFFGLCPLSRYSENLDTVDKIQGKKIRCVAPSAETFKLRQEMCIEFLGNLLKDGGHGKITLTWILGRFCEVGRWMELSVRIKFFCWLC